MADRQGDHTGRLSQPLLGPGELGLTWGWEASHNQETLGATGIYDGAGPRFGVPELLESRRRLGAGGSHL
jgi:hypothetical protein